MKEHDESIVACYVYVKITTSTPRTKHTKLPTAQLLLTWPRSVAYACLCQFLLVKFGLKELQTLFYSMA